jgi:hypothetical protein
VLEIDCPFQGLTVTKAPGHEQFTYSATYVDAITGLPGSYTQRGQHGPIDCVVSVNGAQYGFEGFLTRIVETRRGFDAFQQPIPPTWEIPDRLFNIEDLAK